MTEIQGKSILVRVSARFELARVRVIGSRLYLACVNLGRDLTRWEFSFVCGTGYAGNVKADVKADVKGIALLAGERAPQGMIPEKIWH